MEAFSGLFRVSTKQSLKQPDLEMTSLSGFENSLFDDKENLPFLNLGIDKLYDYPASNDLVHIKKELGDINIKIKNKLDFFASRTFWIPSTLEVLCVMNNQWQTLILQELKGAIEISLKSQVGRSVIVDKIKNFSDLREKLK